LRHITGFILEVEDYLVFYSFVELIGVNVSSENLASIEFIFVLAQ